MESEALRNIRTMRQVKTSLDIARSQKLRTTNSLSKKADESEHLEPIDRFLEQVLQKERKRFTAQEAAVNKSRRRVLRSRDRLAATINRNQALTKLRYELQRTRWEGREPALPKPVQCTSQHNLRQMELKY